MSRRILVVDDEPSLLLTLELAFEDAGLAVEKAGSYDEAIAQLERSAFDAVLLDKNLPGKSGLDIVRWIRARNRTVPLVMMTGYASPESAREGLNLGIDSYLEKPFPDVMEVPELLKTLVEGGGRAGWAPGEAAACLARRGPAASLRILLLASEASREALGDPALAAAPAGSSVVLHEAVVDALGAMTTPPEPGLVIVDAEVFPDLVLVVQAIRETSERVVVAAVTSTAPPLDLLQELITLGDTQLLDRHAEAYATQVAQLIRSLR